MFPSLSQIAFGGCFLSKYWSANASLQRAVPQSKTERLRTDHLNGALLYKARKWKVVVVAHKVLDIWPMSKNFDCKWAWMIFIVLSKTLLALVPVYSRKQQCRGVAAAERQQNLWDWAEGKQRLISLACRAVTCQWGTRAYIHVPWA